MSTVRTVMELITISSDYLQQRGCENPRLDAELLLGHLLHLSRLQLYMNFDRPLNTEEIDGYRRLVGKRGQRTPVSYLTASKEFYSNDFLVTPDVLIPRPETEFLVEKAIGIAKAYSAPTILDLGTGSGIIGISLAKEVPTCSVVAADISAAALAVAQENAIRLGVGGQLTFVESNLFFALSDYRFQMICTNPPYIPTLDIRDLACEVQQEPVRALDGGDDGLDFYRRILSQAGEYLEKPGYVLLEIGWDQAEAVSCIGQAQGFRLSEVIQDYAGNDRVVILQWI